MTRRIHTQTHISEVKIVMRSDKLYLYGAFQTKCIQKKGISRHNEVHVYIYIMHSFLLPLGSINCYVIVPEIERDHYHYLNCPSLILLHIMEIPCYLHRPICSPSDNTPIGDWRSMEPFKSIWGWSSPLWLLSFSVIVRKGIIKQYCILWFYSSIRFLLANDKALYMRILHFTL